MTTTTGTIGKKLAIPVTPAKRGANSPVFLEIERLYSEGKIEFVDGKTCPEPKKIWEDYPLFQQLTKTEFRNRLTTFKNKLQKLGDQEHGDEEGESNDDDSMVAAKNKKARTQQHMMQAIATGITAKTMTRFEQNRKNKSKVTATQESEEGDKKSSATLPEEVKQQTIRMLKWDPYYMKSSWSTNDGFQRLFLGLWIHPHPVKYRFAEGETKLVITQTWPKVLNNAKFLLSLRMFNDVVALEDHPLVVSVGNTLWYQKNYLGTEEKIMSEVKIDLGMQVHPYLRENVEVGKYHMTDSGGVLLCFNLQGLKSNRSSKGAEMEELEM